MERGAHAPSRVISSASLETLCAANGFDEASNPTAEGGCSPHSRNWQISSRRLCMGRSAPAMRWARARQRDTPHSQDRKSEMEMAQANASQHFLGWTTGANGI